jgi:dolichol-phosphate mannosyltransferase
MANALTVVIPAKNEAPSILEIVNKAQRYTSAVIVVDGHSTDGTAEIARRGGALVVADNRRGKGDAIRCAMPLLTDGITVFIDADGSHDPDDIPRLIEPILRGEADHVSGSRLKGGSSELHGGFDECFRLMGSSFITACLNWKFQVCLSESQNGFRAIRTDVLKKLDLRENITTIEQEMIFKTLSEGYRMAEVPTHEHRRKAGESKIVLTKVWLRYVWTLARFLLLPRKRLAE